MFKEHFGENKLKGSIEVICGSMFSGKTEELIRRVNRAKIAKQNISLFKPTIDNRYDAQNIVSHNRTEVGAIPITNSNQILSFIDKQDVVAIDEAQFFDADIIGVCQTLAFEGIRVVVAGLDMDFKGIPFGPMPQLMAISEHITKVHAICIECGDLALFSHRKTDNPETVMLGEKEQYQPLCRNCFFLNNQSLKLREDKLFL